MLFKFFTSLDLVCSYHIPIRKHYFLPLFFLLITQNLCFSSIDLFLSQTPATFEHAYQTTFPTREEIKCQLPHFLKSRTTDLPTFMHLLLFSSIHKRGTVQPIRKKALLFLYSLETIYSKHLRNSPLIVIPYFSNLFS